MTTTALTQDVLRGSQVLPQLDAVAALRMAVFAQWPYLYAGDAGYERGCLAAYAASPGSVLVLASPPPAGRWSVLRPGCRWSMTA